MNPYRSLLGNLKGTLHNVNPLFIQIPFSEPLKESLKEPVREPLKESFMEPIIPVMWKSSCHAELRVLQEYLGGMGLGFGVFKGFKG